MYHFLILFYYTFSNDFYLFTLKYFHLNKFSRKNINKEAGLLSVCPIRISKHIRISFFTTLKIIILSTEIYLKLKLFICDKYYVFKYLMAKNYIESKNKFHNNEEKMISTIYFLYFLKETL